MTAIASSAKAIPPGRELSLAARQARMAFWLLLPTIIILIVVAFYPLARTFLASFTDEPFAKPDQVVNGVGLTNYQRLLTFQIVPFPQDKKLSEVLPPPPQEGMRYQRLTTFELFGTRYIIAATDPDFISSIFNTIIYTVFSVAFELILGLLVAMVVNTAFRGRGLMRAIMLIPWAIPTAISTVLWRHMLGDNTSGAINAIMVQLGLLSQSVAWRSSQPLFSVIFVDVWKTVPFMALLLLAGLQTIPGDLYEAASVDGANPIQQFFNVTLPLLMPTIVIALIFRTLDALRAFDVFQILLGRSTPSMAVYNYEKLVSSFQFGFASAIGVVIFIIIFAFTILYMSAFHVEEE
jgi:trehalose/maltose transport system permease protein